MAVLIQVGQGHFLNPPAGEERFFRFILPEGLTSAVITLTPTSAFFSPDMELSFTDTEVNWFPGWYQSINPDGTKTISLFQPQAGQYYMRVESFFEDEGATILIYPTYPEAVIVEDTIEEITEVIVEDIITTVTRVEDINVEVTVDITQDIENILDVNRQLINDSMVMLRGDILTDISQADNLIEKVNTELINFMGDILNDSGLFINSALYSIEDSLTTDLNNISDGISKVYTVISDDIDEGLDGIEQVISGSLAGLGDILENILLRFADRLIDRLIDYIFTTEVK